MALRELRINWNVFFNSSKTLQLSALEIQELGKVAVAQAKVNNPVRIIRLTSCHTCR